MRVNKIVGLLCITFCWLKLCNTRINFWSSDSTLQLSDNTDLSLLGTGFQVSKGTLKRESTSTIQGYPITFEKGIFSEGELELLLSALYDFDEEYGVVLNGNRSFKANAGTFTGKILIYNQSNRLEGQPIFFEESAVKLQDINSTLTVAIQNVLTSSIDLNNGTLFLENDLRLGDDVIITTSGLVKCFGNKVSFGAKPINWPAGTIEWSNFPTVELNSKVVLDGRWTFSGLSRLVGNGSILDFSNGKIRLKGSGPLYINNVKLKGLGSGSFEFENPQAQIRLSNVEIEMNNDYTLTYGGVYVDGPATIVTKKKILTFDYGSSLTVDGVALNYEPLSVLDSNNIQPTRDLDPNSTRVTLINGGLIRRLKSVQVGPIVLDIPDDSVRISENIELAPTKELVVKADTVFNGSTNAIVFAKSGDPLIVVEPGWTLRFEDIVLRDFKFDYLSLGEGARILFDDRSRIELLDSQEVSRTYTFYGDCVISGLGNTLTFSNGGIELHSSIKFEDVILRGISASQLGAWDDSSTMSFQRVTLYLDNDFTLTKGHFEVLDWLDVLGSATFVYSTNKTSTIWDRAIMTILGNATFHYAPPTNNRDLLYFVDDRSVFALNGGTLSSTTTGIRLLGGTFRIENDCYMRNDGAVAESQGIQVGDGVDPYNDCLIEFITGANLNSWSGLFVYNNVAFE